jgi:hypothetical protein
LGIPVLRALGIFFPALVFFTKKNWQTWPELAFMNTQQVLIQRTLDDTSGLMRRNRASSAYYATHLKDARRVSDCFGGHTRLSKDFTYM